MVNALWISLVGMGLVFVAILLLWGMMALLVRFTTPRSEIAAPALEAAVDVSAEPAPAAIPDESLALDRKRRAAAAAVAVAMALQKPASPAHTGEQPANQVSSWQAAHRASQLSGRFNGQRRKVAR